MPDGWDFSNNKRSRSVLSPSGSDLPPLLTYLLCGLCVALTLAWWGQDSLKGTPLYALGSFANVPASEIWNGRYYGLFTAFFLHINIMHIAFNMMWFLQLGRLLERTLSPLVYVGFLLGAALVGSCAELAFDGETGVGASGVVYAMFGLMWAGRGAFSEWRLAATRSNLNLFIGWGVFCLIGTWAHFMNIGNAAHFGGLLFGLCLGWLFFAPRRRPLAAIPLVLLAALCVLSLTWLPWSSSWNWHRAGKEYSHKRYSAALSDYQRALREGGEAAPLWNNIGLAWNGLAEEADRRGDTKARDAAQAESDAAFAKSEALPAAKNEPEATAPTPEDDMKRLHDKMRNAPGKK